MDSSLSGLATILELNTRLFVNCLDGVTADVLRRQPASEVNHIGLVACHMIDGRCYLLNILGVDVPDPFGGRLESVRTVADMTWCPSVDELLAWWRDLGLKLEARLEALSGDDLARPLDRPFPTTDRTVRGAVAFLAQHESYHLGQIALLRRCTGLPAMAYSSRAMSG
jgi:uncharacterized damage-inducible protein DinB